MEKDSVKIGLWVQLSFLCNREHSGWVLVETQNCSSSGDGKVMGSGSLEHLWISPFPGGWVKKNARWTFAKDRLNQKSLNMVPGSSSASVPSPIPWETAAHPPLGTVPLSSGHPHRLHQPPASLQRRRQGVFSPFYPTVTFLSISASPCPTWGAPGYYITRERDGAGGCSR